VCTKKDGLDTRPPGRIMNDLIYVGVMLVFFVASILYLRRCAAL
jgi:hypothetical protein